MKYSVVELAETFTRTLADVARALETVGVPWMLVGGLAVGGWTEPRATKGRAAIARTCTVRSRERLPEALAQVAPVDGLAIRPDRGLGRHRGTRHDPAFARAVPHDADVEPGLAARALRTSAMARATRPPQPSHAGAAYYRVS